MDRGLHLLVEIANLMYIEKPSVTRLVQKLLERGYVETVVGKDKREKVVQLTEFSENILREVQASLKPVLEESLVGVAKKDIEIARQVLAKIRMNIKK